MNTPLAPESSTSRATIRYASVGTGGRAMMFLDPIATTYRGATRLVGLCDSSLVRARHHQMRLCSRFGYDEVPVFHARDFSRMLAETRPDCVIVTTIDREHERYIVASLHAGCDVVTEKPMTIDAPRCARILEAVAATGRRVRVAFNYRWGPGASRVREVLRAGAIGRVHHVVLEYLLNTSHGADYFRRWHANKADSGGLLVHKSTHHFDLVNWWTDQIPESVFAHGSLAFYGRAAAERRGDAHLAAAPRYHGHASENDPFAYDFRHGMLPDPADEENLYLKAEAESGYVRDQNVFREGITIEDTMGVLVRYRSGMLLNYSLNAYSPYEGFRVAFTGDRGRVEYEELHGAHVLGSGDVGREHMHHGRQTLRVFPHFKQPHDVDIPRLDGAHGGADPLLQEQLFSPAPPPDPLGRTAGHEQGAASILVGIAANESISSGRAVNISDLVPLRTEARTLSELT